MISQGSRLSVRGAWWSYARGLIIRYLPGVLPGIAARVDVMHQHGLKPWSGAWNVMIEMGFSIWTGGIIFLATGWWQRIPSWGTWLSIAVISSGLIVIGALNTFDDKLSAWRNSLRIPRVNLKTSIAITGYQMLNWLWLGWSTLWLVRNLGSVDVSLGYITGAYAISWVIGFLAVFVPSGLGVREAVMIALLSPVLGPTAITLSIATRLIFTAGEALNFGFSWLSHPRHHENLYALDNTEKK